MYFLIKQSRRTICQIIFIISKNSSNIKNETATFFYSGKLMFKVINSLNILFNSQIDKISRPRSWIYCFIVLCGISAALVYFSLPYLNMNRPPNIKIKASTLSISPDKQRFFRLPPSLSKSEYRQCLSYEKLLIENESILLPDISSPENMPTNSTMPIFFHETSCSKNHKPELGLFQACAVESAAISNPNSDIYVLFASPMLATTNENFSIWMQILYSIGNIHFLNNDIWRYATESPAKEWLDWEGLFNSDNADRKLSNYLRLISLLKFGGTAIDFDVISLMSLEQMSNFAGVFRNQENLIGNKVFNFKKSASGRELADACINDFISNYEKLDPLQTGPWIITRALRKICRSKKIRNMTPSKCNFTVLPENAFYPFDEKVDERKLPPYDFSMIENSYAAYFSEKSIDLIFEDSENVFKTIARTYCPRVFSSVFN